MPQGITTAPPHATRTQPKETSLNATTTQSTKQTALVAILAGGRGRRIGGFKPTVELCGRPLLNYPLSAAREAGLQVVVVAKRDTPLPRLSCQTLIEPDVPVHPLCGIVHALRTARRPVLALGCDMPFLTAELLGLLAPLQGAAVVELGGQVQPLIGRWLAAQLPALEGALAEGASLRSVACSPEVERIDERVLERFGDPALLCLNVNDRPSLLEAERAIQDGTGGIATA